jgi:phosphonoacetate hydrolase
MTTLYGTEDTGHALTQRALEVLCSPAMAPMVEMVLRSPAPGSYEARSVDGAVRFSRRLTDPGRSWTFEVTSVTGRNPLEVQDPARFSPLADELAVRQPDRAENSYPQAFERVAQIFDHPCAPDLCVLHTSAHRPTAHRGEHGSLDVIQSRAPFIASGAGVRRRGMVPGDCSTVDVAPTVLALLGTDPGPGTGPTGQPADGLYLTRQDGVALDSIIDGDQSPAEHVVVVLMDGANANTLYAAAEEGTMPNVRRLIESGTALAHGAVASMPTVTLANHTTLNTGAHPGHHGVLHNVWYDRAAGRQVVTESPATWQESMRWLFAGVETIHEAIHRRRGDLVTVSVNEPADRGANYSTMEMLRTGEMSRLLEGAPETPPHTDARWWAASDDYRWGSRVDDSAVRQVAAVWAGRHLDVDYPVPAFTWVSFSLTDAAFHEGGPYSEIARAALVDTDARLGEVLAAVDRAGVAERTAVVVVADHGMEETASESGGDWGDALRAAGVEHRDEASGFLYLGTPPDA